MDNLQTQIDNLRTLQQSYDELSRKMITPLEWTDEEVAKQAIVEITSRIYIIES